MSDQPAITVEHVTKTFPIHNPAERGLKRALLHLPTYLKDTLNRQRFTALKDVSFTVARGESVGVIGSNGSGKSTTLGLIAGVIKPTIGSVTTHGRISPLLELGAGFSHELTGRENILLNGILLGMTRRQVTKQLDAIIDYSGLGEFIDRPLRTYSTGMVARLGFSVAVHRDPEILLLDEVLSVGDSAFQSKCMDTMHGFRNKGCSIVFVSHAMGQVAQICDRVVLLWEHQVAYTGSVQEGFRRYEQVMQIPGAAAIG